MFTDHLERWNLTPDGESIVTRSSRLLPVRWRAMPAMLKVAVSDEEKAGNRLMVWWVGSGAARVLAHEGDAILIERAEPDASLAKLVGEGHDDEASRIICSVLVRLHAAKAEHPPPLVPLVDWFEPLRRAAQAQGGIFRAAAAAASNLMASQREAAILHGDMHHGNVLSFGARGWLAIDPKGLTGERTFDYANTLCNPDHSTATAPGRLARQIDVMADAARLDRRRLLAFVLAWAGLSAAFNLDDGLAPDRALALGELAAAELNS